MIGDKQSVIEASIGTEHTNSEMPIGPCDRWVKQGKTGMLATGEMRENVVRYGGEMMTMVGIVVLTIDRGGIEPALLI
jgi:hypothetical protein